jgi:hypothetical protein
MARATRITKIKFYSINRDIKEAVISTKYSTARIAQKQGVSIGTVQSVRLAKTWPAFVTAKQLKAALVSRGKAAAFDKIQAAPTEKLARGLKKLQDNPVEYVTTKQFTDAIDSMTSRVNRYRDLTDAAHTRIDSQDKRLFGLSKVLNRIQQLKPRWFREG